MTLVCELAVITFFCADCGIFPADDVRDAFWHLPGDGDHFLGLMCLQIVFYDWTPVGRWIRRRISDEGMREPVTTRIISAASRLRFAPFVASAIVIVLLGTWSLHAEFYPLSSWQMFSSYTPGTKVSFYRSYVTYEDGTVARGGVRSHGRRFRATA